MTATYLEILAALVVGFAAGFFTYHYTHHKPSKLDPRAVRRERRSHMGHIKRKVKPSVVVLIILIVIVSFLFFASPAH